MKSYKELKTKLQESVSIAYEHLPKAEDGGLNMFAIEDARVSDRLNAALYHVNANPTIDPKSRLVDIKKVISHAGLDFDHSMFEASEDDPVSEFPLTQFGGRMGMTPEEGYVNDDGISHRTGGVKYGIRIETTKGQGGLWSLDAKIMPLEEDED